MKLRLSVIAACTAAAFSFVATPASAVDVAVYNLDSTAVGAFGAPNYGTVTLTQSGTSVDFSVVLRDDLNFVSTGNANSKAVFSFNAMGVVAGDIGNIADASGQTFSVVTPGNNSPFGQFTFGILCASNCSSGGSGGGYADPLTFSVANATLADFNILSTGGNPNAYFAADVYQASSGSTGGVGATSVTTPVPEPETYALMLAGLGAMSFVAKRRRAKA